MTRQALLPGMPTPRPVDDTIRALLAAGTHAQDMDMLRAHGELSRAVAHGHEAVASGAFTAWLHLWRQGVHSAFVVDDRDQQHYQRLARAGLRLDHHLTGADLRTTGPAIAPGDHLVVTETTDLGSGTLERGVLLHVAAIDDDRSRIRLDVPTAGVTDHVSSTDPAWRHLDHAYTETGTRRTQGRSLAEGLTW